MTDEENSNRLLNVICWLGFPIIMVTHNNKRWGVRFAGYILTITAFLPFAVFGIFLVFFVAAPFELFESNPRVVS